MRGLRLVLVGVAWLVLLGLPARGQTSTIVALDLSGVVDPIIADYISTNLARAEAEGAAAVLITIDTPGGLDSSMREIVKAILNTRTPVVCYVAPEGARAASAGAFILTSCDVAAMAPGTNVGAASPVGLAGVIEQRKATNDAAAYIRSLAEEKGRNADWAERAVREADSVSADEGLELGAIDLVAPSSGDLLTEIDGMRIDKDGTVAEIEVEGTVLEERGLGLGFQLLHFLLSPDLAFLLFYLGIILIVIEVIHPGFSIPGIVGALSLIGSFIGLGMLPVQLVGIVLLLASAGFMVLELQSPGISVAGGAGVLTLILGGLLLFNPAVPGAQVSPLVIAPVAIVMGSFVAFVAPAVLKARRLPVQSGQGRLIGSEGVATTAIAPRGTAQVGSELWTVESVGAPIAAGETVKVVAAEGLRLKVEPAIAGKRVATTKRRGGTA